jgi:hypothetical protein
MDAHDSPSLQLFRRWIRLNGRLMISRQRPAESPVLPPKRWVQRTQEP